MQTMQRGDGCYNCKFLYLGKGYSQKLVQQLKTMIHVAVLGREGICYTHGSGKQGKINVKTGYFQLINRENKKDAGHENSVSRELMI